MSREVAELEEILHAEAASTAATTTSVTTITVKV